jgi:polyisoprenoid-binding protein YceI
MRTLTFLLLILAGASPASAGGIETYRLDPVHTQILFFADHLGFSHGIGRVKTSQGWFQFDADDWSSARADIGIDLASLDMGDARWTDTVRSAQFFDVARWPSARFVSTSAEKTGTNTGVLHGQLTLRGITKPIDLDITFNRIGRDPYAFKNKAGFTARATLDRFDFGMQRYRDVVGATVELRIEVEGISDTKAKEEQASHATEEH